jgi:oxaloacetate decarboxylase gamma subunit
MVISVMEELFIEAALLMVVGMVFVYAFLGLLIFVIKWGIAPLSTKFEKASEPVNMPSASQPAQGIQPSVVAAISVAITRYRQKNSK